MKEITIEFRRKPGDEWFYYKKSNFININLSDAIKEIKFEDYFIYKMSNKFRKASVEETKQMLQSGYIFFRKDKFSEQEIDEWIEFIYENKIGCGIASYLNKPFPPQYVKQKIRIIE